MAAAPYARYARYKTDVSLATPQRGGAKHHKRGAPLWGYVSHVAQAKYVATTGAGGHLSATYLLSAPNRHQPIIQST